MENYTVCGLYFRGKGMITQEKDGKTYFLMFNVIQINNRGTKFGSQYCAQGMWYTDSFLVAH